MNIPVNTQRELHYYTEKYKTLTLVVDMTDWLV
jgi:hypothetical protein